MKNSTEYPPPESVLAGFRAVAFDRVAGTGACRAFEPRLMAVVTSPALLITVHVYMPEWSLEAK